MKKLEFCPNCGSKIPTDGEFCPNCGFNLKEYDSSIEIEEPKETIQPISKPLKAKRKRRWILPLSLVVLVLILLGGSYVGGLFYFSQSNQIKDIIPKLTSTDPKKIAEVVVDSDDNPIGFEKLKPLSILYKSSPQTKDLMEDRIKNVPTRGNIQVIKEGKIFWFYPRYKVLLKPISYKFKTNLNNPSFTIDDESIDVGKNKDIFIDKKLPGKYTLRCKGKAGDEKKDIKKELTISPFKETETISLNAKIPDDTSKEVVASTNKSNNEVISTPTKKATNTQNNESNEVETKDEDTEESTQETDKDNSIDMSNLDPNSDDRNDNSSTEGLLGHWEQSSKTTFDFNSDGTYDGLANGVKSHGKFKVVYREGNRLNVQFTPDESQPVVEPFQLIDGHLIETNLKLNWHRSK